MRSLIFCLATAVAVSSLSVDSTYGASGDDNRAQQIAGNLKQSGKLKDYRVGVKYEDGVAWLSGTVTSEQQRQIAELVARNSAGVKHVVNKLEIESAGEEASAIEDQNFETASNSRPQQRQARASRQPRQATRSNMPVPYARTGGPAVQPAAYSRQVQYCPDGGCMDGGMAPAPMGGGIPGAVGQSASYDNPQMPGYAWPSYASSPNYAALTYPKQYSASAWPYIGPFYPYPQVPLGWRKVTMEWDDGWWFLDFKDK